MRITSEGNSIEIGRGALAASAVPWPPPLALSRGSKRVALRRQRRALPAARTVALRKGCATATSRPTAASSTAYAPQSRRCTRGPGAASGFAASGLCSTATTRTHAQRACCASLWPDGTPRSALLRAGRCPRGDARPMCGPSAQPRAQYVCTVHDTPGGGALRPQARRSVAAAHARRDSKIWGTRARALAPPLLSAGQRRAWPCPTPAVGRPHLVIVSSAATLPLSPHAGASARTRAPRTQPPHGRQTGARRRSPRGRGTHARTHAAPPAPPAACAHVPGLPRTPVPSRASCTSSAGAIKGLFAAFARVSSILPAFFQRRRAPASPPSLPPPRCSCGAPSSPTCMRPSCTMATSATAPYAAASAVYTSGCSPPAPELSAALLPMGRMARLRAGARALLVGAAAGGRACVRAGGWEHEARARAPCLRVWRGRRAASERALELLESEQRPPTSPH